jgi:transposase
LHAIVSEGGTLVRYLVTGGQVNDVTQAGALVEGLEGAAVVGDRAYDADAFIERIASVGMRVVIPSRANRRWQRWHDEVLHRQRNVLERYFGRLKQYRRVATRYDKTALSYLGFVATAALLIALSGWR